MRGAAPSRAPAPGGDAGRLAPREMPWVAEHGETARDRAGKVHGPAHSEEPLDAKGRQQAIEMGTRLRSMRKKGEEPGAVYHSPARRARQTARIAAAVAGLEAREAPELRSLDAGWLNEAAGGDQKQVARSLGPYFAHPGRTIPGGETVAEWKVRVKQFMQRAAREAKQRGEKPPLFVTHSNVVGLAIGKDPARAMARPPEAARARRVKF